MDAGSEHEPVNSNGGGRRRRRRRPRLPKPPGPPEQPERREKPRMRKLRFAVVILGLAGARVRLLDLRDHDGGRPGPALAREPRAVQARPRTRSSTTSTASKLATLTNNQGRILLDLRRDRAGDEGGRGRDRGPALLRPPRRRFPGHRPRRLSGHPLRLGPAGRLDDHPAVRQERTRGAGQPDRLPEAPRGGARLPPRAPVVEGQDPHRVPERDLLRRGRDRDRGGRAHLLRLQPSRLRRGRDAEPCASQLLPWEAAMLAGIISSPSAYSPRSQPRGGAGAAQPGAPEDGRPGLHHRPRSTTSTPAARAPDGEADPAAAAENSRRAVLHLLAAPAARRPLRRRRGVRRRPADHVDARPRAPERGPGDRREPARRDRPTASVVVLDNDDRAVRAMVGGPTSRGAVQPRHQRPPPARLVVQAVHAGHRARAGPLDRRGLHLGAAGDPVPGRGPRRRTARRRWSNEIFDVNNYDDSYLGSASTRDRDHLLRQLRLRAARHRRSGPRTSPRPRRRWASRPTSRPTPTTRSTTAPSSPTTRR